MLVVARNTDDNHGSHDEIRINIYKYTFKNAWLSWLSIWWGLCLPWWLPLTTVGIHLRAFFVGIYRKKGHVVSWRQCYEQAAQQLLASCLHSGYNL